MRRSENRLSEVHPFLEGGDRDSNPGRAALESEPMSTAVYRSSPPVSFGAGAACGPSSDRETNPVAFISKVRGMSVGTTPAWLCPLSPSRPLGVFLCVSPGSLAADAGGLWEPSCVMMCRWCFRRAPRFSCRWPPGSRPAQMSLIMRKPLSPGKAGRRCQGRGPRASAGLDPPARGLGQRLGGSEAVSFVSSPAVRLQSHGYRFRVCKQTETLRSEVFKGPRD